MKRIFTLLFTALVMVFGLTVYAHAVATTEVEISGGPYYERVFNESAPYSYSADTLFGGLFGEAEADASSGVIRAYATTTDRGVGVTALSIVYENFALTGRLRSDTAITVYLTVSGTLFTEGYDSAIGYLPSAGVYAVLFRGDLDSSLDPYWPYLPFDTPEDMKLSVSNNNFDSSTVTVDRVFETTFIPGICGSTAEEGVFDGCSFRLFYGLDVWASGAGSIADFLNSGRLSFDLPPGTSISSEGGFFQTTAAPIPEPSTLLLLGSGLAGLAVWRKRLKG